MTDQIYDLSATTNTGETIQLEQYRGKVLLIVNTASQCGFTPHYGGLQALYQKYKERGLLVIGFPCDQFGHQEPGSDEEIASFCTTNYNITFPLMKKVEVNGAGAHPVFRFLKSQAGGLLGDAIKWNFTKFLVSADGKTIKRYAPTTTPEAIEQDLLSFLTATGASS